MKAAFHTSSPFLSDPFYIQSIQSNSTPNPLFASLLVSLFSARRGGTVGRRGVNIQTPVLIHFIAHSESLLGHAPISIYPQQRCSLATGIFSHISLMPSPVLWEAALTYHKLAFFPLFQTHPNTLSPTLRGVYL